MYPKIMHEVVRRIYINCKFSIRKIANLFHVSKSSVHNWIRNKSFIKVDKNKSKSRIKIDKIKQYIEKLVTNNPFITIDTIKKQIKNDLNIDISNSSIYKYLKILNFSHKRVSKKLYGKSIDDLIKQQKKFMSQVNKIHISDIICYDESYFLSNQYFEHGWSKCGSRIHCYEKSNPIKYSLMMAIGSKGIIKSEIHKTNIGTDLFFNFLFDLLKNHKNKYILMDNVSFHKSKKIIKLINDSGNHMLFIPPYSPQFNGIEYVFSMIKNKYRSIKNDNSNAIKNITDIINNFQDHNFSHIYKHCYRNNQKSLIYKN